MSINGNTNGKAAFEAAGATASFLGRGRARVNLSDPSIDPTGRVDVLAARALQLAMSRIDDPVLQVMFDQFQPVIDHHLHQLLGKRGVKAALETLGIVPPGQRKRPVMKKNAEHRRTPRQRRGGGK